MFWLGREQLKNGGGALVQEQSVNMTDPGPGPGPCVDGSSLEGRCDGTGRVAPVQGLAVTFHSLFKIVPAFGQLFSNLIKRARIQVSTATMTKAH